MESSGGYLHQRCPLEGAQCGHDAWASSWGWCWYYQCKHQGKGWGGYQGWAPYGNEEGGAGSCDGEGIAGTGEDEGGADRGKGWGVVPAGGQFSSSSLPPPVGELLLAGTEFASHLVTIMHEMTRPIHIPPFEPPQ